MAESKPSGCPVDHGKAAGGCPVDHSQAGTSMAGLNALNFMEPADQRVAPGQSAPLSTTRVASTIPMGSYVPAHQKEGQETWQYPSEQQYFNAMKRKGWDPQERDMKVIVSIHNTINEKGWAEVVEMEKTLHADAYVNAEPKLVRFMGRPKDLTPKARLLNVFGMANLPFDRHDWIVDRNGEEIRYVIDFYSGQPTPGKPISVYMDVRPALDNVGNAVDRLRMQFHKNILPLLPFRGALFGPPKPEAPRSSEAP
ncbi:cytochrome c1 heme lyase [Achlya hypogyna]|uniref:Holocytochrome c-type synthase n=1 Tax=Achlya hypogyna TaxID=1202772 RepID=A0A1V9Z395_ACHHY|nr:cytochrome c1 heme lyase [Achlya hypogyna]